MTAPDSPPTAVQDMTPPVAARRPHRVTVHGDTRVDDYAWLREKGSPEVTAYLEAENAYAEALTRPMSDLADTIYGEIVARVKQTDLSVPFREGGYLYYSRTEEGKQYPIRCRKQGDLSAPEEVLLDLNALVDESGFIGIGALEISPDGRQMAYTLDRTGFREYTLQVKNLATGVTGSERIEKVKSVAWAADSATLFYAVDDHAKRPYRIFRHTPGEKEDVLIQEEDDERFRLDVWPSRSGQWIFVAASSHTTTEIRCLPAAEPTGTFRLIAARRPDIEYSIGHHDDAFYILVNDTGRNFRLVRAPVDSPGRSHWTEVIAHSETVMLDDLDLFARFHVLHEREDGLPHLRVTDIASGASHRIAFPEAAYSVAAAQNREFDSDLLRFTYQSLITPRSVYDYDMKSGERTLLKQVEVLGGYDPSHYESRRLFATAPDGTRIPISLVRRKGSPEDGSAPMYLTGYGAYGYPFPVYFDPARVSLLDRGVSYAIAHVRGGGEMGKKWHDDGRMFAKKNTFTDFISVAEHLIEAGLTSADQLAIEGGSAGGLLMGAVVNMRPDLFHVVVARVPFVDVLNTMLDDDAPLTVGEFEEWGNPAIKEQYEAIREYGPYTNLRAQDYPTMLVKTSLNDSQVMYWEPAKYVARLRALKTDSNPLVFAINMAGGHSGSSGRYDRWREDAFDFAFVLHHLGITR
ncbi:MAG: S9 family peptidase [Acidobacteriota bacterium]